ncbi:flagella basal body P-ring formation protein FlgA [Azospirillum agricola]|uniref:flagellar basal body P-ring formation chaperone FlgA n=1 Tax=Azospirillum agricola TaxID=1720247 RepID=UPI001AEB4522|nr:flagellar basal body P-ring formation chaperone FlgA [Azospirillum agricola]MBP2231141.1 flagella basal body P-ring formation protein FlgA [Azospirillum agricola]
MRRSVSCRPRTPPRGRRLAAALLALSALLFLPAPSLAGIVETMLAEELLGTLGPSVPADARVSLSLATPFDGPVETVRDIVYDARTGTFRAQVASNGRIIELSGRAEIEVEMPVPTRRIRPGEVIEAVDLTTVRMPLERAGAGYVASADSLIGLSPRRQMPAGRLIHVGSVGAPIVVQRNRPVTLVYEDGPLLLAARGRALQEGGVGDVVRVMNIASSTVVTGTVTGAETVSVSGPRVPAHGAGSVQALKSQP